MKSNILIFLMFVSLGGFSQTVIKSRQTEAKKVVAGSNVTITEYGGDSVGVNLIDSITLKINDIEENATDGADWDTNVTNKPDLTIYSQKAASETISGQKTYTAFNAFPSTGFQLKAQNTNDYTYLRSYQMENYRKDFRFQTESSGSYGFYWGSSSTPDLKIKNDTIDFYSSAITGVTKIYSEQSPSSTTGDINIVGDEGYIIINNNQITVGNKNLETLKMTYTFPPTFTSDNDLVSKEYVDDAIDAISGGGGGGTVTSVTAGNGMNFSTITTTGGVVLGTPSTNISETSTNSVTSMSHNHAIDFSSFELEDLGDVPTPTANYYLRRNSANTAYEFATVSGAGDMQSSVYDPTNVADDAFDMDNMVEGATNKILTSTERTNISNNKTFYDTPSNRITAGVNLSWDGNTLNAVGGSGDGNNYTTNVTLSGTDLITARDGLSNLSTSLSPLLSGYATQSYVLANSDDYGSWTAKVDGVTLDNVNSGYTLDFIAGTNVTLDASDLNNSITINASGGGGVETFQTLTSSTLITWDFDTSKNANLTIGHNVGTFTISNQDNGENGTLIVTPNASTSYTIDFGSLYFANGYGDTFTIEAGTGTVYVFTFKYNGSITTVDYATYSN